jgi:hypothetical protein
MAEGMVKVKLHARCLVDGKVREAGEIVELPEKADDGGDFATSFGEIVKPQKPESGKQKPEGGEKVG